MSSVLVVGGTGEFRSNLVPKLLELSHHVQVVDLLWFGCSLPDGVPPGRKPDSRKLGRRGPRSSMCF